MKTLPVSTSLMQSQALDSLESPNFGAKSDDSWASIFSLLISSSDQIKQLPPTQLTPSKLFLHTKEGCFDQSRNIIELSATGYNIALADPDSAYEMMTVINYDDVLYKAQFFELTQVETYVAQMQDAGRSLGRNELSTGNDIIRSSLQDFVKQYNRWIQRINPDIQQDGLLADTQAAQVSQYELEQNLNNRCLGSKEGIHGLRDLGITIDPYTRLATLDATQLDLLLATNKQGVVDTVQEFSENFAKSASLHNSEGNFILRQLDNLNRAIHYIANNKASLQAEFGAGNAARPAGQVAEALTGYNLIYGV